MRTLSWVEQRSAPVFATMLAVVAGFGDTVLVDGHEWQSVSDLSNSIEISWCSRTITGVRVRSARVLTSEIREGTGAMGERRPMAAFFG